jgi:hypothetical protein
MLRLRVATRPTRMCDGCCARLALKAVRATCSRSRSRLGTDLEICSTSSVTSKAAQVIQTSASVLPLHGILYQLLYFPGPEKPRDFHPNSAYDTRRWPPPPRPTRPALSSVRFCARASSSPHTTFASTQRGGRWMLSGRPSQRATRAKCRS